MDIGEIVRKLKFKSKGVVVNAPEAIAMEFVKSGFETNLSEGTQSGNTLVFIPDKQAFMDFLVRDLRYIAPDSVLWFAYPKGTSKLKTDINRDSVRETGEDFGITTVTAVSIDETWTALRFRPIEKVGT